MLWEKMDKPENPSKKRSKRKMFDHIKRENMSVDFLSALNIFHGCTKVGISNSCLAGHVRPADGIYWPTMLFQILRMKSF